jgi:hypothetical protein
LFAATAAITFQFARQQPVSSLKYPSPATDSRQLPPDKTVPASRSESWSVVSRPFRPVYPHSLVPGGVESLEELRQAMARDPVVAQHFQGFDFKTAHLAQVSENQSVHVAYRLGDQVYWTRKKISLHPGETLISDGKITARTRCGNRVALTPLGPSAMVDPYQSDLDSPLFANDMVTPEVEGHSEPTAKSIASSVPEVGKALQAANHGKALLPLFFLPLAGLPGGSSHEPLAVVPEPGTLLLVSTGLGGVYLRSRKWRRKR